MSMMITAEEFVRLYGPKTSIVFYVSEDALQNVAEGNIKRRLTEDELQSAAFGVEWGLSEGLDIVMKAAIEGAVIPLGRTS